MQKYTTDDQYRDLLPYFIQHQHLFLSLINSPEGRGHLKLRDTDQIDLVIPNGYLKADGFNSDKIQVQGKFWSSNVMVEFLFPIIERILILERERSKYAPKTLGEFRRAADFYMGGQIGGRLPRILFSTFSPDSSEGFITASDSDFGTCRNKSTGTLDQTTDTYRYFSSLVAGTHNISRGFMAFDVTAFADSAVVSDSDVSYQSLQQTGRTGYFNQGTQSDVLAAGDFDLVTTTNYASFTGDDNWTTRSMDLGSSGDSYIQSKFASGKAKFCLRDQYDHTNVSPSDSLNNNAGWRNNSWASAPDRPILTVLANITYTATFNDTVAMTSSIQRQLNRTFTETPLSMVTVFLIGRLLNVTFNDSINVQDFTERYLNGVASWWTKLSKTVGSWTKQEKS